MSGWWAVLLICLQSSAGSECRLVEIGAFETSAGCSAAMDVLQPVALRYARRELPGAELLRSSCEWRAVGEPA